MIDEGEKQMEGLAALIQKSLMDLIGHPTNDDLREEIIKRLMSIAAIADELVEHESEEGC